MSCADCDRGAALNRAVGALADVVARVRGDEAQDGPAPVATCEVCGYKGHFRYVWYACVGCGSCADRIVERHGNICVECEPLCPICEGDCLGEHGIDRFAEALVAAEGALKALTGGYEDACQTS